MTALRKPRRRFVKLATILVATLILSMEVISLAVRSGREPSVQMVGGTQLRHPASDDLIVYFPSLAAHPKRSYDVLRPVMPNVPAMAVRYAPAGYDPEPLFAMLDQSIKAYGDSHGRRPRLIFVGVSFGAGVALRYRLHQMAMAEQDRVPIEPARFILYSPVVAGIDLKPGPRALGVLAHALRGGVVSQALWTALGGSRLLYPGDAAANAETAPNVLSQRLADIDAFPLALLSSELRAMRAWKELGAGAMGHDTVLIFGFNDDGSLTNEALPRTAALFRTASIYRLAPSGHADIERVTTVITLMGRPIHTFLDGNPDTPETR